MRLRLIAGLILAALLLYGIYAYNPTKAGADEVATAPTITATVSCDTATGTWVASYTVTGAPGDVLFVYPDGGAPTSGTLSGLPATIAASGTATFSVVDIPATTALFIQVDVVAYGIDGSHDLYSYQPISGTCAVVVPTTTTTTTAVVTPPDGPVPPQALSGPVGDSPPLGPVPAVSPAPPPTSGSAPLAFTGFPYVAVVSTGLALIAAGFLLLLALSQLCKRGARQ